MTPELRQRIEAAAADLTALVDQAARQYTGPRAIYTREPKEVTDLVRDICGDLLEAAEANGMSGCDLCQS